MKIIYTHTDEAPALATQSLLPIVEASPPPPASSSSCATSRWPGRILAQFPDRSTSPARRRTRSRELGELAKTPEANIIKLPNISASVPQLKAAIAELQQQGYAIPDYPDEPADDEQREIRARYDQVKGSAVNPVLREGNSDRRAPASVKAYARKHPHSMGAWSPDSRSHVSTMTDGDFRSTERSVTVGARRVGADRARRRRTATVTVLSADCPVLAGEVLDAAVMRRAALDAFLADAGRRGQGAGRAVLRAPQGDDDEGVRSDHLRPCRPALTSRRLFAEHATALAAADVNANDGLGALLDALERLPDRRATSAIGGDRRRLRRRARTRHGRLRPRDHQPARPLRRDHRRLDAGGDPRVGPDVEPRRRAAGHEVRDPRPLLRRAVRRDRRGLPPRTARSTRRRWAPPRTSA